MAQEKTAQGFVDLCASLGITEDSGSESEGGASRGWPRVYLGTGGRPRQWPKGGNGGSRRGDGHTRTRGTLLSAGSDRLALEAWEGRAGTAAFV